ncbi:DUF4349 domain-containing protein [Protofrankia symbiont of Coriaria ruscifolia]|uniref:DUF4349 domain-containing protein n=1 Tax=Protofrankia symbiont of Coriaria ruscifolia TaxID=1306542 RepID=UPI001F5E74CB|nr:DUF4349 domain-containing protein [Protofrankia symbiont of Coriaria ruscifolia]
MVRTGSDVQDPGTVPPLAPPPALAAAAAESAPTPAPGTGRRGGDVAAGAVGAVSARTTSRRRVIGVAIVVGIVAVVGGIAALGSALETAEPSSSITLPAAGAPQPETGSSGVGSDGQRPADLRAVAPAAPAVPVAPLSGDESGSGPGSAQTGKAVDPARPAGAEPRIVRTGSMSLEVRPGGVDAAVAAVSTAAKGLGGYLASLDSSGTPSTSDDDDQHANVTLRVPTGSFDELRGQVGRIGEVRASTVSSQDVTGVYVDLQSRLKALGSSRDTYVALLGKAGSIGEILAVQQQIDNVQVQIEQLEGRRQVLADSSDLATLTVRISEQGTSATRPDPDGDDDGLAGALRLSWDRFTGGVAVIVGLVGPAVLILLLAGAGFGGYRILRRVRHRRRTRAHAVPAAPTS